MQLDNVKTPMSSQLNKIKPGHHGGYASGHFDHKLDQLIEICSELMLNKGVFHLNIHFSSSQLICWTFDNPYNYQVYSAEEVFSENFMRLFAPLQSNLHSCISRDQIKPVLQSIKFLRRREQGSELRNASVHRLNGYISLGFACDDTRYINFKNFVRTLNHTSA